MKVYLLILSFVNLCFPPLSSLTQLICSNSWYKISFFLQVWDKSESGEWHCTASWKVSIYFYGDFKKLKHLLLGSISDFLFSFENYKIYTFYFFSLLK